MVLWHLHTILGQHYSKSRRMKATSKVDSDLISIHQAFYLLKRCKRAKVFSTEGTFDRVLICFGDAEAGFTLMLRPYFHALDMYRVSATVFTICQRQLLQQ